MKLSTQTSQATKMTRYYRFQSRIYDITRWSFLFGRKRLVDLLPFASHHPMTILEVGCGTGYNLNYLTQAYPNAKLIGVDTSADMMKIAQRKLRKKKSNILLYNDLYNENFLILEANKIDVVLFSYCLTMVNPNWETLILQAKKHLKTGGCIALVDFHDTPSTIFKKWMTKNHVKMEAQLLPFLEQHFSTVKQEMYTAYFGVWRYVLYVGRYNA